MSEPQTINAYLAALNASLEVGLRNRRRILAEVEDHLCEAAHSQMERGISPREAQRHAVVAFGPAEQVAARFDAGLAGALDRRLARSVRWIHHWVTERRWGAVAFAVMVLMLFGAALGTIAAAFGRDPLVAASGCLSFGVALVSIVIVSRGFRRYLRNLGNGRSASMLVGMILGYPTSVSCLDLLLGSSVSPWHKMVGVWLVLFSSATSIWLIDRAIERAARRYAAPNEHDRRQAWNEDHPWGATMASVAALPLSLVTLIAVFPAPAPAPLRIGLIALVGLMAALATGAVRLESARRERDAYQRVYMSQSS